MKTAILAMLALAALAPVAFAQTWCEESCCEENGGSWDSDLEWCSGADSGYYTCLEDSCSSASYGSTPSGGGSCCGSGFILAAVGGLAFLRMKAGAA